MIRLKTEYPFIFNGEKKDNLIRHYAEDGKGNKYRIIQKETGIKYDEAVDVYPCKYTYETTDEKIEDITNTEE